jgi:quinohemoprotein ethanol dehydrogenase
MMRVRLAALGLMLALAGCHGASGGGGAATVDQQRIENADGEPQNWLSYGRTYSEQRFSPLTEISTSSVGKLGLAWTYETREGRGAEATPIVVDGVMYVTSAWSVVYALDATTGKELWVFDPQVDRSVGAWACCDVINRGVAVWKGHVYVGATDGRLIAINAKDGSKAWEVATFDKAKPYTISGAPRIAKGLVFIGNSGAEFGVRGYVSAYDADTGKMKWRFYTVPGNPADGPDHAASDPQMAMIAKTWKGDYWKYGGGGTVWDSIVYDAELDQLYIGVGNGAPWDQKVRSPGGGDNLFLTSIVALKPETGQYLWHFQETAGESWDYTATQPIMLATLKIGGADRKVLMHAPKNGFFYVLDRATGKFVSGKNFVPMAKAADTPKGMPISWAYGLDANGRALENPEARYMDGPVLVTPSGLGAHNWQPMSYSPQTGLVYLPAKQVASIYFSDKVFVFKDHFQNTGNSAAPHMGQSKLDPPAVKNFNRGMLIAWDPVAQKAAWSVPVPEVKNGGTLATAGGLVFWGRASGQLEAFDARTGKKLLDVDTGAAIIGAPITYAVGDVQYVAVMNSAAIGAPLRTPGLMPQSRVLVYKLGGTAALPLYPVVQAAPAPPAIKADPAQIARGDTLFAANCSACHGPRASGMGVAPDLRRSPAIQDQGSFRAILAGALAGQGMPDFKKWITPEEADAIRAYVAAQAGKAEGAAQRTHASNAVQQ